MIIDYVAIGLRIKKARKKAKITQEVLASKVYVSTNFINSIERGSKGMSLETLASIANALSVSVDDLLCDNLISVVPVYHKEAQEIFADCSCEESRILVDGLAGMKSGMRKNEQLWENLAVRKDE
ncbi:MAG: helix-turn-helix transcriptional regulator [Peptococcaceae bacterium]|nr:helix-turn-helix transcriptional regulator [Peptococcaceae bacterium]